MEASDCSLDWQLQFRRPRRGCERCRRARGQPCRTLQRKGGAGARRDGQPAGLVTRWTRRTDRRTAAEDGVGPVKEGERRVELGDLAGVHDDDAVVEGDRRESAATQAEEGRKGGREGRGVSPALPEARLAIKGRWTYWAMQSSVLSPSSLRIVSWMSASVSTSTEDVASSRTMTLGGGARARVSMRQRTARRIRLGTDLESRTTTRARASSCAGEEGERQSVTIVARCSRRSTGAGAPGARRPKS